MEWTKKKHVDKSASTIPKYVDRNAIQVSSARKIVTQILLVTASWIPLFWYLQTSATEGLCIVVSEICSILDWNGYVHEWLTVTYLYAGCFNCTEELWNTDADGFTCGQRIQSLIEEERIPESEACIRISERFPGKFTLWIDWIVLFFLQN